MTTTLWNDAPTVFAVERDTVFCQILRQAARSLGFRAEVYTTSEDLLEAVGPGRRGCVAVDLGIPRCHASQWIAGLAQHGVHLPVIVVSTRGEVPLVVEAMRAGAINYVQKPCETEPLAEVLREAVAWDAEHARDLAEAARFRRRLGRLSPGERQVLDLLANGMTNQDVAAALELSVRAIEARRAKIREKMRTKSLAELVRHLAAGRDTGPGRRLQPTG